MPAPRGQGFVQQALRDALDNAGELPDIGPVIVSSLLAREVWPRRDPGDARTAHTLSRVASEQGLRAQRVSLLIGAEVTTRDALEALREALRIAAHGRREDVQEPVPEQVELNDDTLADLASWAVEQGEAVDDTDQVLAMVDDALDAPLTDDQVCDSLRDHFGGCTCRDLDVGGGTLGAGNSAGVLCPHCMRQKHGAELAPDRSELDVQKAAHRGQVYPRGELVPMDGGRRKVTRQALGLVEVVTTCPGVGCGQWLTISAPPPVMRPETEPTRRRAGEAEGNIVRMADRNALDGLGDDARHCPSCGTPLRLTVIVDQAPATGSHDDDTYG